MIALNKIKKVLPWIGGFALLVGPLVVEAEVTYKLLRPLPGFSGEIGGDTSLVNYLQNAFYLIIGLSAIVAILMGVIYGFEYMFSSAAGHKSVAKDHLTNIAWGVGLLVSAYLILYTINPNLLDLQSGFANLRVRVDTVQSPNQRVGNGSLGDLGYRNLDSSDPPLETFCRAAQSTIGTNSCRTQVFDPSRYEANCSQSGGICNPSDAERITFESNCRNGGGYFNGQNPRGGNSAYCVCRSDTACPNTP